jgi:hypothetical protein
VANTQAILILSPGSQSAQLSLAEYERWMNGREAQSLIPPYGPRSILPSLSGTAAQAAQLATGKIRKPYVRKPYVRGIRHARSPRQRDAEIKRTPGGRIFAMQVFTRTMADRPATALHATYYVFDLHPAAISLLMCCAVSLSFADCVQTPSVPMDSSGNLA